LYNFIKKKKEIKMIRSTLSKKLLVMVVAVFLTLSFLVPVGSAAPTKWKVHAMWPASFDLYKLFAEFCEKVTVMSNGQLEMKPYAAGAIVPNKEALDALKYNTIQGMYMFPVIWSGHDPAFALLGDLSAAWSDAWEVDAFFYEGGGLELINELYEKYGAYAVGVSFAGKNECFVASKPVGKVDDFKGLKWRAPEGMSAQLFAKLGTSVVVLPSSEVYTSMDKGLIDGGDLGTMALNKDFGIFPLAKYTVYPGWHSLPTFDFVVNLKEWNKLPPYIQQIVRTAWREFALNSVESNNVKDVQVVKEIKQMGVTVHQWSDEELSKVREIARSIWEEEAQKSPMAKKVYDAYMVWLKKLGRF
jgi:TRAP-type mannitol/chloroaromatic compound transport system substrate-binding protein